MTKKLMKNQNDKKVSGVLSGVADYFNIDASVVRILFIILLFVTAFFPLVIIYFFADWILPNGEKE